MARRLKLKQDEMVPSMQDGGGVSNRGTGDKQNQSSKMQSLLTNPEAKRMMQLDEEMMTIKDAKNLRMEEKVRRYEETLAEFRQVRDLVLNKGGVMMKRARLNDEEQEKATKALTDVLKKFVEEALQSAKAPTSMASEDNRQITAKRAVTDDSMQGDESDQGTKQNSAAAHNKYEEVKKLKGTKMTDETHIIKRMKQLLGQHGVVEGDGQTVQVPLVIQGPIKTGLRRSQKIWKAFKKSTYNKVLAYLFETRLEPPPAPQKQWKNLLQAIHQILSDPTVLNEDEYELLLKTYPALNQYDMEAAFSGWESDSSA
jgi:hypothetical protein